jgi:hypothetical protein
MIERKIIIGLIVSTDYMKSIRSFWDTTLLESATARQLASWCWEYFERYSKAPVRDIEGIFYTKVKDSNIPEETITDIESILNGLSDEYEKGDINLVYLIDETKLHFTRRRLELHVSNIKAYLVSNDLKTAEQEACNYKPVPNSSENDIDLSSEVALQHVEDAFRISNQNLVAYPGVLGKFWNDQFVRGGLVAFLAPEKRGKTFQLIDIAMRACKQNRRVAFFQAGDLTEATLIKRICIYLAWKSDKEKYCRSHFQPVRDCIKNQLNECNHEDRVCKFGIFEGMTESELKDVTLPVLIESYKNNPEYLPCHHCEDYATKRYGTPWIKEIPQATPLSMKESKNIVKNFFMTNERRFKVSTHPNNTLSLTQIRAKLDIWEKEDEFVPDVIIIDYADLLATDKRMEFRHQQNEIWKGLRRLSQEKGQPLVVTATQADAASYEKGRLRLSNFSEDKRKYGHVTAFFGLNQDPKGREKAIGIMRINELILREDEFDMSREITILQNLRRGRPCLASYW